MILQSFSTVHIIKNNLAPSIKREYNTRQLFNINVPYVHIKQTQSTIFYI